MGDKIDPAGWRERHPGETHSFDTAWYAEFDSTGPGAHPSGATNTPLSSCRMKRSNSSPPRFWAALTTGVRSNCPSFLSSKIGFAIAMNLQSLGMDGIHFAKTPQR